MNTLLYAIAAAVIVSPEVPAEPLLPLRHHLQVVALGMELMDCR